MSKGEPLSIRQLEVFVSLVECGSFTRAARHLGLSQSTVSGHVADLEKRLRMRLVERDRGGIKTTPAGAALLRPAREALLAERNARLAVEELSGLLRGTLVVGGSTIPASYILPGLFAEFRRRHPGVSLRLVTGDSREILDRVASADVEVGVVGSAPERREIESRRIGEDRLVLVLAPSHPLATRRTVTVSEVLRHPLILREEGSGTRAATLKALGAALDGTPPTSLQVACEVGSTEAMKAGVRAGLGLAFISSLAVSDEVAGGTLKTLAVKGFEVRRTFFLIHRAASLLSPAARAFLDIAPAPRPIRP